MREMTAALKESFSRVGREFGYDDVDAEFTAFKELKIKWQRSKGKAEFKVSDYLADAGPEILEGMARTLFSRICGRDMRSYPDTMNEWITSDDFVRTKQPVYLRRSRNLTRSHDGTCRNLMDSYQRLADAGLVEKDPDIHLSWTREPNIRRVGYCSVLMKVIAISCVLDNEMIPEFVLDFVVYHELIHIRTGFDPFGKKHGAEFKKEERKYERWKDAEGWLKKLCLYL